MTSGYRQTYDRWRADPQGFWAEAARQIERGLQYDSRVFALVCPMHE